MAIKEKHILLISDDAGFRIKFRNLIIKINYKITTSEKSQETSKLLAENDYDLIIIASGSSSNNCLTQLKEIKALRPATPVIIMTEFINVRMAVNAIKLGATDIISKPIIQEEITHSIQQAFKNSTQENLCTPNAPVTLPGKSKFAKQLKEEIALISPTNMTVLITGESGTGKEYVAQMIHKKSNRANKNFYAIDCGVLSYELAASELFGHTKGAFTGATFDKAGLFELAHGGTVFLDEIGNLKPEVQMMLLRAIQEKKICRVGSSKVIDIDIRILAATNENLKTAISNGKFREDLYHRLNEYSIHLPPIHKRQGDIKDFALIFLKEANRELEKDIKGFTSQAEKILLSQKFKGNLRELKNTIKRSVLASKGNLITEQDIKLEEITIEPLRYQNDFNLKSVQEIHEKKLIVKVLEKVKHNKSKAAKILNIDRKTLYNKLNSYGILNQF